MMYGFEAWTNSKQLLKFPRREEMLQILWTAQKSNETAPLINRIRKRQATFFGQAMRREKLEYLVTLGMIEGKRSNR